VSGDSTASVPKNYLSRAKFDQLLHIRNRPYAPAKLDRDVNRSNNPSYSAAVSRNAAVKGSVESTTWSIRAPAASKLFANLDWVAVINRYISFTPLRETNTLPIFEINCGNDQHISESIYAAES